MMTKLNRAIGCLYGQAIGDALGARYEFKSSFEVKQMIQSDRQENGFLPIRGGGPFNMLPGQITDDTEMTMTLARMNAYRRNLIRLMPTTVGGDLQYVRFNQQAYENFQLRALVEILSSKASSAFSLRSLLRNGRRYDAADVASAYYRWCLSDPPDIGVTTKRALLVIPKTAATTPDVILGHILLQAKQFNQNSQSNGSLMRQCVLPILHAQSCSRDQLHADVEANCSLTHYHPVVFDASRVYATALHTLIRSEKEATAERAKDAFEAACNDAQTEDVKNALAKSKETIEHVKSQHIGYVLVALQAAFYALQNSKNFTDTLTSVVELGGDTDTNGCIAGAILGALYSADNLPEEWKKIVREAVPRRYELFAEAKMFDLEEVATKLYG